MKSYHMKFTKCVSNKHSHLHSDLSRLRPTRLPRRMHLIVKTAIADPKSISHVSSLRFRGFQTAYGWDCLTSCDAPVCHLLASWPGLTVGLQSPLAVHVCPSEVPTFLFITCNELLSKGSFV